MSSAFLHLMKIIPALPEIRALAGVDASPSRSTTLLERLVEVVQADQAHPQVAVARAVVDAADREVQVDRVGVALERQRVADLELLVVGELPADRRSRPCSPGTP